jgi:hypothetical protein
MCTIVNFSMDQKVAPNSLPRMDFKVQEMVMNCTGSHENSDGGVTARLCRPGARSGLPYPVPACCCIGQLEGAGSGSHSGVELCLSRTGKGSSGGRKKGVV